MKVVGKIDLTKFESQKKEIKKNKGYAKAFIQHVHEYGLVKHLLK